MSTHKLNITKSCFWTDSSAVLCWITHEKLWKQYIRSRVNKIRALSEKEQWRFCPGSQNPIDLPTRGMSANELLKSELWHHEPQYLRLPPDQWPTIDCPVNASANEEL